MIKPFFVFVIDITIQNRVGAEQYGFYFSLFSLTVMLNIFLDLGTSNFNNRNIAQNPQLFLKHFPKYSVLRFFLGIVYSIIVIGVGLVSGYDAEQFQMLLLLVLNQFLLQFVVYLRSNISGLQRYFIDSVISVFDRLILILLMVLLLWTNWFSDGFAIEYYVYAQTIAFFLTLVFSIIALFQSKLHFKLDFDWRFFTVILKQSFPYALLIFLMAFYNRFDGFIIERLLPDGKIEAGIYAQSFRILDALSQFALLFAGILLPLFSKMIKDKQNLTELIGFSYLLIAIPSLLFIIPSFFYAEDILSLLYDEHIQKSIPIFSILLFSFFAISTTYIFGTLLTAKGSLKILNITAFAGVVINIGLNLLLIPTKGALGAAISSLSAQSFAALSQIIWVIFLFKLKINGKLLIKISVFIITIVLLGKLSLFLDIVWYYKYLALALLGFMLIFVMKIFKIVHLKQIIPFNK